MWKRNIYVYTAYKYTYISKTRRREGKTAWHMKKFFFLSFLSRHNNISSDSVGLQHCSKRSQHVVVCMREASMLVYAAMVVCSRRRRKKKDWKNSLEGVQRQLLSMSINKRSAKRMLKWSQNTFHNNSWKCARALATSNDERSWCESHLQFFSVCSWEREREAEWGPKFQLERRRSLRMKFLLHDFFSRSLADRFWPLCKGISTFNLKKKFSCVLAGFALFWPNGIRSLARGGNVIFLFSREKSAIISEDLNIPKSHFAASRESKERIIDDWSCQRPTRKIVKNARVSARSRLSRWIFLFPHFFHFSVGSISLSESVVAYRASSSNERKAWALDVSSRLT